MADEIKKSTIDTPPSTQLSTPSAPPADENRRRTRSQTRNGGIVTPPAPIPESRGRKRGSQGQPGSGAKKGKKATPSQEEIITNPSEVVTSTEPSSAVAKETETHSEKTTEPEVKAPEKSIETTEPADVCKRKTLDENKDDADKQTVESKENVVDEPPAACPLPPKEAKKAQDQTVEVETSQSVGQTDTAKPDVAPSAESAPAKEDKDDVHHLNKDEQKHVDDSEQKSTSEQSKIETSTTEVESNEKPHNNSTVDAPETDGNKQENAVKQQQQQQQTKVQESGDGKLDATPNADSVKGEEKTTGNEQPSATPV